MPLWGNSFGFLRIIFWRNRNLNRREFARLIGLTGVGFAAQRLLPGSVPPHSISEKPKKVWVWIGTDTHTTVDEWKSRFEVMRNAGIDAILPEIYNSREAFYGSKHLPVGQSWLETILPLAKDAGLEVHAWMWTMPCNVPSVVDKHPEWFVVNRLGESSTTKPAYVDYYKFLCPSRPDVWEFVGETVSELSQITELNGVHLDYIRYPDVILPVGLQPKYHIVQNKEYPQYDYCYCDVCRGDFKKETGIDPMKLEDPSSDPSWNRFRYERITHIVNDVLLPIVHKKKKLLTAAVFPNWKNVRQQWSHWKLDGAMPMLYARFYNEGVTWIGEKTRAGAESQKYGAPVYSGLSVGQLSADELVSAVQVSFDSGGSGVSLFSAGGMTPEKWRSLTTAVAESRK